ncbi:helix-turn-helix transcriptional regulator [Blastococcus sp. HT6-30]|uniref:helix-turn-helix domain-containing protein n=1 Tax=Blastococcus sp. HT6-30 TaxID=3144843 RepID=UPI00321B7E87
MPELFDLCGALRRIRRLADMSQRELAEAAGLSASAVAHGEAGTRDLPVTALARAAGLAGLRIALLDGNGDEVPGMDPDAVRDRAGRRFPAHLDTMLSEERASRWEHRPRLQQPTYTFDRRLPWEDAERRARERPDDHLRPQPGDSPGERAAVRKAARRQRDAEHRQRRFLAGELAVPPDPFTCSCPPTCDELDDRSGRPVHTDDCPCRCDVG